ncbi:hypothetical protein OESDEN_06663 [Oesophagostomum dentatum]|uniref:Acyltransferase C-terminal domain-containing protein n=1 Tax=Oesophagostomum dentatum TaxID=61180 RepID=A0A0B1T851_OESDE|nr:hypothetical protein OESDEN_06663 [Oesophagostomum dentatum]
MPKQEQRVFHFSSKSTEYLLSLDLIMKGDCPREVHFHVKKISVSEVPKGEAECGRWLNELWLEKELRLEEFYSEPKPYNRRFCIEKGQRVWRNTHEPKLLAIGKRFCFWFWMFVVSVVAYHLTFLRPLQLLVLYFLVVFFVIKFLYGSLDKFVLYRWKQSLKS